MLDADGSIGFSRGRLRLSVTNLSGPLMDALVETMGGSFSQHQRVCSVTCERSHVHVRRVYFGWELSGERAAIVLRGCLPFLVVKPAAARAALAEWMRSTKAMRRPSRRTRHMAIARGEMLALGWEDASAPTLPPDRCTRGHILPLDRRCRECQRDATARHLARQLAKIGAP